MELVNRLTNNRLTNAWSYTQPSGSMLRRSGVMATWGFMKVEESLTDAHYRRRGLYTGGRDYDLYGVAAACNGGELSGYTPTKYRTLREIFRSCRVGPDDVLLEYGSGKGRVVIWAAMHFPFRRVIGIELDEHLHTAAKANLARWNGRLSCKEIVFTCEDATEFEVPDDATIIFLGNPFNGDVFKKMLARIQASLARQPRSLQVLYYHPWMHDALIDSGFFIERRRNTPPYEWSIYRHPGKKAHEGAASPDDPAMAAYWADRRKRVKSPLDR
jgi:Histone methylation protein DOT1